jgi:hypothetical protein
VEGRVERRVSGLGLRKRNNKELLSALLVVGRYHPCSDGIRDMEDLQVGLTLAPVPFSTRYRNAEFRCQRSIPSRCQEG